MVSVAFSHLKFPDYEFREYPKWVKDASGNDVIVHSKSEELSVCSSGVEPVETNMLIAATTTDEKPDENQVSEDFSVSVNSHDLGGSLISEESNKDEISEGQLPVDETGVRGRRRRRMV
jgi:hypothetical protein